MYSKFILYKIIESEASEDIKNGLFYLILQFGVVQVIRSDNGSGFLGPAVKYFCEVFNIAHFSSIPRNSRGQSTVEMVISQVQDGLRALLY